MPLRCWRHDFTAIALLALGFGFGCDAPAAQDAPTYSAGVNGALSGGAQAPPFGGAAGMTVASGGAGGAAAAPALDSGLPDANATGGAGGVGGSAGASAGAGAAGNAGGDSDASLSGAGGAGGMSAGYQPCPQAGDPCKVLPLGDSITVGLGDPSGGGYRVPLFRKALEADQSITFVGSQSSGPGTVDGAPFSASHEGHSGRTIDFIADRIPDPAFADAPHIILLMIGTNDMYMQPSGAPERLADLLDEILELEPEALLVVAQLTPFPASDAAVQTYNAAIPQLVEARAEAGKHILLVDMYTDFPEALIGDGVHPNEEGYALMAERWYAAIGAYLSPMP